MCADYIEVADANGVVRKVLADEGTNAFVQGVKITYSADASETPVLADANGVEVQGAGVAGTPAGGVASVQGVSGGTEVPVSGTITAELSATDNAVLDAIALAVATDGDAYGDGVLVQGDDGTNRRAILVGEDGHVQVDVLSTASHAVTNAGTFAVQATLAAGTAEIGKLAAGTASIGVLGANSGVDIGDVTLNAGTAEIGKLAAGNASIGTVILGAGTAEIGKLAAGTASIGVLGANSGVDIGDVTLNAGTAEIGKLAAGLANIGDVDVASMPTDTFAADAQAYGKGVLIQGDDGTDRRSILVGTDGHVQVDVLSTASHAVTNAGTFATQATLQAGTAEIGKLAAGTASIGVLGANSGVDIGDVTLNAGTAEIGKLAAGTASIGVLGANSGVDIGDVTLNAGTAEIGKLAAGTASIGVLGANAGVNIGDVFAHQATAADLNCTEASAANILTAVQLIDNSTYVDDADWTDDTSSHTLVGGVYQSAPHTVTDGDVSPIQVDVNGRQIITGQKARDAAVATTPVTIGGTARALAGTTSPTAVNADADSVDLLASRQGVLYTHPHGAYILSGIHAEAAEAHTDIEVIAAVADLVFNITDIVFSTDTDATTLKVETDTAGGKTALTPTMQFKAGGGCALHFVTPIRGTVSKNIGFTTVTSHTGGILISGYYSP